MGLAGVSAGYGMTESNGFGLKAGIRLLDSFNRGEYGDQKVQIIIPEGNLTFSANELFSLYGGLNAAVLTGSTSINKYKTQIGAQAGCGINFTKQVALNAGYTILRQKLSDTSDSGLKVDIDAQLSGFNSALTYTF